MILPVYYWYWVGELSEDFCNKLIKAGQDEIEKLKNSGRQVRARTMGSRERDGVISGDIPLYDMDLESAQKQGIQDNIYWRDTTVGFLDHPWIFDGLCNFVFRANEQAGWNWDVDWFEPVQYGEYVVDQFYSWHSDASAFPYKLYDNENPDHWRRDKNGEPIIEFKFPNGQNQYFEKGGYTSNSNLVNKIRKLSVTVMLSDQDEFEGGNFQLDLGPHHEQRYHNITEINSKGSIIVFPSFMLHQVTPVTKGLRKSLVVWGVGPKYK